MSTPTPRTDAKLPTVAERTSPHYLPEMVYADFARTLERELAAERARLERIRRNCSVFYWPQGKDPYPIEHNPRAGKDQWETIDAAMKEGAK